jgi:hypothetical protein
MEHREILERIAEARSLNRIPRLIDELPHTLASVGQESGVVAENLAQFDQVADRAGYIDSIGNRARSEIEHREFSLGLGEELGDVQLLTPLGDS